VRVVVHDNVDRHVLSCAVHLPKVDTPHQLTRPVS
jgi:hypothetical protein